MLGFVLVRPCQQLVIKLNTENWKYFIYCVREKLEEFIYEQSTMNHPRIVFTAINTGYNYNFDMVDIISVHRLPPTFCILWNKLWWWYFFSRFLEDSLIYKLWNMLWSLSWYCDVEIMRSWIYILRSQSWEYYWVLTIA